MTHARMKLGPTGEETRRLVFVDWTGVSLDLHFDKLEGSVVGLPGRSNRVTVELKPDQAWRLALEILESVDDRSVVSVGSLVQFIRDANK